MATTIIPRDVAKLATEILPVRLGVSGATLLVLDDLDANLISPSGAPLALSKDHVVWRLAYRANGPTMLREAVDCTDLGLRSPALMLPLQVGGRLVGIYVLGARPSAINYTRDELGQLMVLGHHLAVAVENGRALRTERTVKFHTGVIFQKLGVTSRTEAATAALKQGLVK